MISHLLPVEMEDGFMTGAAAEVTPTIEDGVLEYTQEGASAENYNFKDSDGNDNDRYYLIKFNPDKMSTFNSIKWEKSGEEEHEFTWNDDSKSGTGTIKIELPHNNDSANPQTDYYTYTYTTPNLYDATQYSNMSKSGSVTDPEGTTSDLPYVFEGGAALYNPAGDVTSIDNYLFYNNKTTFTLTSTTEGDKYAKVKGGAIYNAGTLTSITADFINNSLEGISSEEAGTTTIYANGGAIFNETNAVINKVVGNFVNNSATRNAGAIYNEVGGTIDSIEGDFIANKALWGGAIRNHGYIGSITGNFIMNTATNNGGALNVNTGSTIDSVNGTFINNSAAYGGAVYSAGNIGTIKSDFINNTATYGAAIYLYDNGSIDSVEGDFIGNFASERGAGIYSRGTINSIKGNFIGNNASSAGCGIHNSGIITSIDSMFIENTSNFGAAVMNWENIDSINSSFINNSVAKSGGAIYNGNDSSTISSLNSTFIGNKAAYGGAIYNQAGGIIKNITSDFNSNTATSYGGGICNYGTINFISGDFVNNKGSANGGGIFNNGATIDHIEANFIGNSSSEGGGINNYSATIKTIIGDFINNSGSWGGSGLNSNYWSTITTVKGDFIGNIGNGWGSALYTMRYIHALTGDFIGNRNLDPGNHAAAIGLNWAGYLGLVADDRDITFYDNQNAAGQYRDVRIHGANGYTYLYLNAGTYDDNGETKQHSITFNGEIVGTCENQNQLGNVDINKTMTYTDEYGATITKPTGGLYVFNNKISGSNIHLYNGAQVKLGKAKQSDESVTYGNIDITNIENINFTLSNDTQGGMINSQNTNIDENKIGTMTLNSDLDLGIDVDITEYTADTYTTTNTSTGILNVASLDLINGNLSDILNQTIKAQVLKTPEETLYLADKLPRDSEGNYILSDNTEVYVDINTPNIKWNDVINKIEKNTKVLGDFEIVTTETANDSIEFTARSIDRSEVLITDVDSLMAINQFETTEDRTFTAANSSDEYIVKDNIGTAASGKLTVQGVADGGTRSTLNFEQTDEATGDTVNHSGFVLNNNDTILTLKDVEVKGSSALVSGYATDNVKVVLDNVNIHDNGDGITTFGDINIKGNSTISDDISVYGENSKIDVDGTDVVILDSRLAGNGTSALNLANGAVNLTDNASVVALDTTVQDVELNVSGGANLNGINATFNGTNTLNIANETSLNGMNPTFNDKTILNIANSSVGTLSLGNVNLNGILKMQVDADLANKQMDKITATSATVNGGSIEVNKINLLSPTTEKELKLLFTNNKNLSNAVSYTGEDTITYSPIYKYKTSYDVENDMGYFKFGLAGGPDPSPDSFNPAVLTTPAMTQAGLMANMNTTMNYAFQHSDGFTKLNRMDRFASINANKYALSEGASTDFNQNMANMGRFYENKGAWVRPYASFENVPLKNGPRVDAISYGTLVGFDTNFKELRNGWDTVFTGYLGYNGAHLSYTDVSTTMNGGMLGGTQTWYKGNFWTAITATAGASVAESSTMYGHEDNVSILAGIGSKTGYNFEFADGKFIMQPIWYMNYSMIKTLDYTNAAGVRIDSDPLHTIQLNPSIRFIGNLKHGWQPYASVGMVWNIMNETKAYANNVKLPEMSIKPYVEYGVGVQKQVGDRFTGYFQAMMRNGGRNGIALTGGFRWALGHDGKPIEKVQNMKTPVVTKKNSEVKVSQTAKNVKKESEPQQKRKILKQFSESQKSYVQRLI